MKAGRAVAHTVVGLAGAAAAALVIYQAVDHYSQVKQAYLDFRSTVPQMGDKAAVLAAKAAHIKVPSVASTIALTSLKLYGVAFGYFLVYAGIEALSLRSDLRGIAAKHS